MKPMYSQTMLKQIKKLKKIELHAHLFGSIRREELLKRMQYKGFFDQEIEFKRDLEFINFDSIFAKLFNHVEKAIKTKADLEWMVESVVEDFAQDNVVHLELRTGLKKLDDIDEEEYLRTILKKFEELSSFGSNINCQLILSLNRRYPPEKQQELFKITRKVSDQSGRIRGIDFSGDVRTGRFSDYKSILDQYQESLGLGVSIHAPELAEFVSETQEILDYLPQGKGRIGHFLHYSPRDFETVVDKDLMIELCPSSNFVVLNLKSWEDHHMKDLLRKGLKQFSICTDDILLFDSSLSEEWAIASHLLDLSIQEIQAIIMNSVKFSFCSSKEKDSLKLLLEQDNIKF